MDDKIEWHPVLADYELRFVRTITILGIIAMIVGTLIFRSPWIVATFGIALLIGWAFVSWFLHRRYRPVQVGFDRRGIVIQYEGGRFRRVYFGEIQGMGHISMGVRHYTSRPYMLYCGDEDKSLDGTDLIRRKKGVTIFTTEDNLRVAPTPETAIWLPISDDCIRRLIHYRDLGKPELLKSLYPEKVN